MKNQIPLFDNRQIKIKGWDTENSLLVRLNAIDCRKGLLFKENYVLLQFTGLSDKSENEIYEGDILLISTKKYLVFWDETRNGWAFAENGHLKNKKPLLKKDVVNATRLCSYLESQQSFD